jgi:hypothetical protein
MLLNNRKRKKTLLKSKYKKKPIFTEHMKIIYMPVALAQKKTTPTKTNKSFLTKENLENNYYER